MIRIDVLSLFVPRSPHWTSPLHEYKFLNLRGPGVVRSNLEPTK